jgi:hypothetical protein
MMWGVKRRCKIRLHLSGSKDRRQLKLRQTASAKAVISDGRNQGAHGSHRREWRPHRRIDKVEGNRIKLTRKDSGEGSHKGHHHFVDPSLVAGVEGNKVSLSTIGAVAVTTEEEE